MVKEQKELPKWFNPWFAVLFLVLTVGCGWAMADLAGADDEQQKPEKEIEYFDSEVFDFKLGLAMRRDLPTVTVKPIVQFTVNDIPERLDKWFTAVKEYGGSVNLRPDPEHKTRMIGAIFDLIVKGYQAVKELLLFKAAKQYNAVIYYIPGDGTITRAEFIHKTAGSAAAALEEQQSAE
jgi:hypothetical protein